MSSRTKKTIMWIIGIILIMIVLGVTNYVLKRAYPDTSSQQPITSVGKTYTNSQYGISFNYPEKYELREQLVAEGVRNHYNITLTSVQDITPVENGEGPTTISFDFYQNNLDNLTLNQWLTGTSQSNFKLSPTGTFASTTVAGTPALQYEWDGLYRGRTTAFIHKDNIVAFTVTYIDVNDQMVKDAEKIISNLKLQ